MGAKILAWFLPLILSQPLVAEAQVALPGIRRLEDVRLLHVRDLIRTHRGEVEADPNGAPILRGEVVAFSPTDAALERARVPLIRRTCGTGKGGRPTGPAALSRTASLDRLEGGLPRTSTPPPREPFRW